MTKLDFSSMSITPASTLNILLALALAFIVGLFIYFVYRMNFRGVLYSPNVGLTLVLMTLITTPVVMCIRESVTLSMGMVGALSIVRFRTAVKDPLDTVYMFWALTMGILIGASQFFLAIVVAVGIALLIFVLNRMNLKPANSYLLVVRCAPGADAQVAQVVSKSARRHEMKTKTASRTAVEMTMEVRVEKQDALLSRILGIEGVKEATMIAYQSETV